MAAGVTLLLAALSSAAPRSQPVPEEDDNVRLDQVRSRRESLEQEIAKLRRREKSLLGDVERLELEVKLRTTQLREAMDLAQQASQLKSEFLANMSHEIGTPLSGVMSLS